LQIRGFNNALLHDAQGWLNDNHFVVDAHECNYFWHHCNTNGSTGSEEAKAIVENAHIQGGAFQHAFWNETDKKSIRFRGIVEDPHRFNDHIINGPHMKIQTLERMNWSTPTQSGVDKANWGIGTTVNGVGFIEGNGKSPSVVTNGKEYWGGELVAFKDTDDGSGDGLYMKGPWQVTNEWIRLSSDTIAPAGGNG
jgi:hypothetical protein